MIIYDITILFLNIFLIILFISLSILTLSSLLTLALVYLYPPISTFLEVFFETAKEIDNLNP